MYPTLVIVLIETQLSMTDVCEISPSNGNKTAGPVASETRPATLEHLSFAQIATDNEADTQRQRALRSQGGQEHGWKVTPEVKEESGWH